MNRRWIVTLMVAALAFGGCAGMGTKEGAGTLIGAGTGALIGSQFGGGKGALVAVAVGTLAGALMGQEVGRSLDRADRLAMEQSAQYALENAPSNQSTNWVNPDTGNSGAVTPVHTYQDPVGQPCREYLQTVRIGDKEEKAYGTACRQTDGSWKITG